MLFAYVAGATPHLFTKFAPVMQAPLDIFFELSNGASYKKKIFVPAISGTAALPVSPGKKQRGKQKRRGLLILNPAPAAGAGVKAAIFKNSRLFI